MRKITSILFVLALLLTSSAFASPPAAAASPAGTKSQPTLQHQQPATLPPVWGANYKANTDTETCNGSYTNCAQQEPEIAINPHNNLNAVATFKDWRDGFKQIYIATTFDGGQTWVNQLPPGIRSIGVPTESDGVAVFGADGAAYVTVLAYGGPGEGVYFTKSADGGATWSNVVAAYHGGQNTSDKDWLTVDTNPFSPYYNRLYATWSSLSQGRFDAVYSSDGGATWSAPAPLNGGPTWVSIPVVLHNGNVLVTMYGNGSNITQVKSTNGGVSWSVETNAVGVTDVFCWTSCQRGANHQNWRMSTMQAAAVDPNTGNIYMVWVDQRNDASNGWDIMYSRSTNEGTTWSAPTRLNDDPPAHFIDQVLPTVAVAPDGTVHVAWMDKRDDPNNVLLNLYYTYSTDQGVSWQPDTRLSTASSDYNIGIPTDSNQSAGDYMGISAITDTVWITWMDTRNNQQDVYTIRGATGNTTATPTSTPGVATTTPTPTSTPGVATTTATRTPAPPTASPTAIATNTPAATTTPTAIATGTITPAATATPTLPTATATLTAIATGTTTPAATDTATPSPPPGTPTPTPYSTATLCPNPFVDINGNPFYQAIVALACRGVVSGVDGSHFEPRGTATRAQFSKMVVLGYGYALITPTSQSFTDVPPGYWAYAYIETAKANSLISGYSQQQCAANNAAYPCFLPNRPITRAELTVLVVRAAHYALITPGAPTYTDVPPGYWAYAAIETASSKGVVTGYPDHTFRPNNNIRRDELAAILYRALNTP